MIITPILGRVKRFYTAVTGAITLVATVPPRYLDRLRRAVPTRMDSTPAREDPAASRSPASGGEQTETEPSPENDTPPEPVFPARTRPPATTGPPSLDLSQYVISLDGVEPVEREPPEYRPEPVDAVEYEELGPMFDEEMERRIIEEEEAEERLAGRRAAEEWLRNCGGSTLTIDHGTSGRDADPRR